METTYQLRGSWTLSYPLNSRQAGSRLAVAHLPSHTILPSLSLSVSIPGNWDVSSLSLDHFSADTWWMQCHSCPVSSPSVIVCVRCLLLPHRSTSSATWGEAVDGWSPRVSERRKHRILSPVTGRGGPQLEGQGLWICTSHGVYNYGDLRQIERTASQSCEMPSGFALSMSVRVSHPSWRSSLVTGRTFVC